MMLSWSADAHCAAHQEAAFPEAVYYANAYADHYGVPRELVHAIIEQESGWNQNACLGQRAMGLMQLTPATAMHFVVTHPTSMQKNIGGGVPYLAALKDLFHGDLRLVVAAYYCEHHILSSGLGYHNLVVLAYVSSVQRSYEHELLVHQSNRNEGQTK
jgi:soluble lytic murein transglycosylase-like protein